MDGISTTPPARIEVTAEHLRDGRETGADDCAAALAIRAAWPEARGVYVTGAEADVEAVGPDGTEWHGAEPTGKLWELDGPVTLDMAWHVAGPSCGDDTDEEHRRHTGTSR
jgi:hypothetical protein